MFRSMRRHPWLLLALWLLPTVICALTIYLTWGGQRGALDATGIVARARPAIVGITMESETPRLQPKDEPREASKARCDRRPSEGTHGSGFLIDPAGFIVTNDHVVARARKILVTLADGRTFEARVAGRDPTTDLALLKIDTGTGEALPVLRIATSSDIQIGEPVIAIGNPLGYIGSASQGIVSGLDRIYIDTDPVGYIQHDAAINPGSSGGPILNRRGEVIGINTAIPDTSPYDIGIGLAIPATTIQAVAADLRRYGRVRRAGLGVTVQQLDGALATAMGRARHDGLAVSSVTEDSPAQEAGLLPGDILLRIDTHPLRRVRDLIVALSNYRAGQAVDLVVIRNGREQRLGVRLEEAPQAESERQARGRPVAPRTAQRTARLGLAFAGDLRPKGLAAAAKRGAAVVAHVDPDGSAYRAGVAPGDEILAIGNTNVRDRDHAIDLIGQTRLKFLALLVRRDGQAPRFVVLPFRGGARADIDHAGNSVEPAGGPF
jgi:S1-C subfamily serine protease